MNDDDFGGDYFDMADDNQEVDGDRLVRMQHAVEADPFEDGDCDCDLCE